MKAVILAAGRGTRLLPLTRSLPKCLVPLHGKPIMQYQLECLDRAGIQDCVIVVGYLGHQVERQFGLKFGNMHLTYITNERFSDTNNLYSLWLARKEISENIILLEGDIVFEFGLLEDIDHSPHSNVAVVDRFQPHMDGTVILAEEGLARNLVLKSEQSTKFLYQSALKTVNIYLLSQDVMSKHFLPTLDEYVAQGKVGQFYEAALSQLVSQDDILLGVHLTGTRRWAEIDTEDDLRQAERVFDRPRSAAMAPVEKAGVGKPIEWYKHLNN